MDFATVQRILIIEDDEATSAAIRSGFESVGFTCEAAMNGADGCRMLLESGVDLVVLDWMLPDLDGVRVLEALRCDQPLTPVIMLTARDAVDDKVTALDAGADDYLVKPFAFPELLARVRSLLRRGGPHPATNTLTCGPVVVDRLSRNAEFGGKPLVLTPREFDLLAHLLASGGDVVSRDELAREVWHEENRATSLDNVIDVHITRLRRKLAEFGAGNMLKTVRGVGFHIIENP